MYIPQVVYLPSCRWTFGLFTVWGNNEKSCYVHSSIILFCEHIFYFFGSRPSCGNAEAYIQ